MRTGSIQDWSLDRSDISAMALLLVLEEKPDWLYDPSLIFLRKQRLDDVDTYVVGNSDDSSPNKVGATRFEYYLDPRAGYAPIKRVRMTPDGQLSDETHIIYSNDSTLGCVPSSFSYRSYRNGQPFYTLEGHVTSFTRLRNIDESLFQLEFPAGTRVFDRRNGINYTAGNP